MPCAWRRPARRSGCCRQDPVRRNRAPARAWRHAGAVFRRGHRRAEPGSTRNSARRRLIEVLRASARAPSGRRSSSAVIEAIDRFADGAPQVRRHHHPADSASGVAPTATRLAPGARLAGRTVYPCPLPAAALTIGSVQGAPPPLTAAKSALRTTDGGRGRLQPAQRRRAKARRSIRILQRALERS